MIPFIYTCVIHIYFSIGAQQDGLERREQHPGGEQQEKLHSPPLYAIRVTLNREENVLDTSNVHICKTI